MGIYSQFQSEIRNYGAECRIVSINHLQELESEYLLPTKNPLIDKQFYEKYIQGYIDFSITEKHPTIRSLIIIATPSPQVDIKFQTKGHVFWLKVPPTYTDRLIVTGRIKKITSQIFDSNGYETFPVTLPKKLIAVHSGLAKYGKNNLVYVEGMGSYHRLTLFATDLPCRNDSWQGLKQLERCEKCFACQNNCPVSAIDHDNFVIKAERCLTYFNEQPGQFPDWIGSTAHNCVVGCMKCQKICPENKGFVSALRKEEFNEDETMMILNKMPYGNLPENLQKKISGLCLKHYYKHLSRNMLPLIETV